MPCSLVFRHDAFCHRAVDRRHHHFVGGFGCGLVTGLNSPQNVFDGRADVRTLAGVVTAVAF